MHDAILSSGFPRRRCKKNKKDELQIRRHACGCDALDLGIGKRCAKAPVRYGFQIRYRCDGASKLDERIMSSCCGSTTRWPTVNALSACAMLNESMPNANASVATTGGSLVHSDPELGALVAEVRAGLNPNVHALLRLVELMTTRALPDEPPMMWSVP